MEISNYPGANKVTGIIILAAISVISCKTLPKPGFLYSPTENPEAGEVIQFTNETTNASSFSWDFGEGGNSAQENPQYIFQQAGIFNVRLTAYNEAGEESIIQPVTIFEPTVLGFLVYTDKDELVLSGARVSVYDNESDWEKTGEPLMEGMTDSIGELYFYNMEPIVYHIWVVKEETGGQWSFGGYTSKLEQNAQNNFTVPCVWVPGDEKSVISGLIK